MSISAMAAKHHKRLIFVYNADSGVFNTMADIAHKMFSPETYQCQLCAVTHGLFSEKQEWRAFIEQLGMDVEFLHRDEFMLRYPQQQASYPVIMHQNSEHLDVLLDSESINACDSIPCLSQRIISAIDLAE